MKHFIISQPKAGTYLAANIFENLGIYNSKLHFDPGLTRRFESLSEFETLNLEFNKAIKKELHPNHFSLGHMPYINGNINALKGIKKTLVIRDRQEIIESARRYEDEKGLKVWSIINERNLDLIERWSEHPGVFVLNFQDMIGRNIARIDELQTHLFREVKYDSSEVLDKALSQDSLTKSSIR